MQKTMNAEDDLTILEIKSLIKQIRQQEESLRQWKEMNSCLFTATLFQNGIPAINIGKVVSTIPSGNFSSQFATFEPREFQMDAYIDFEEIKV
jgi:hypothetical protein